MPSHRRPESILVVVYTGSGDVLLMQRSDMPDYWQSITGSLEHGESIQDAARRELAEETGIDQNPIDQKTTTRFEIVGPWRKRYRPEDTHNTEHVFSVRLESRVDVVLNKDEHLNYIWLPAAEAMIKTSSDSNRRAIKNIVLAGIAK